MSWLIPAASLVAILGIAGLTRLLGLGGDVRIGDAAHALRLAREAGYDSIDAAVDRAGQGALVECRDGFVLVRRHGVHFAARRLHAPVDGRLDKRFLTLGARDFGRITLDLGGDAPVWAARLRTLA